MKRLEAGESSSKIFKTISEAAEELKLPQHVLRFWENKFSSIKPMRRRGGRRYYRPEDIALLKRIHELLHKEGYTIKGVQRLLKENGVKTLIEQEQTNTVLPPPSEMVYGNQQKKVPENVGDSMLSLSPDHPVHKTLRSTLDELKGMKQLLLACYTEK